MITRSLCALAAVLLLAACGGGGGGGGPVSGTTEPPFGQAVPADPGELLEGASPSLHRLSPTMEASAGGSSLSAGPDVTDVNSSFDGERVVVTLGRSGADDIRLDSANTTGDAGALPSFVSDDPDRSGRMRSIFDGTSNSATFGDVVVDWSSTDPTDYVAAGFWIYAGTNSTDWEFGAFVDGPELRLSDPPVLPTSGTASYEGQSIYLLTIVEDGEIAGQRRLVSTARLRADFSGGTIEGCVVCQQTLNISVGRTAFDRSNGTFQGSNLTATSPSGGWEFTQSGGQWAGRFSNIQDSSGSPRLAAGTFAATALESDGAEFTFFGSFGAVSSE